MLTQIFNIILEESFTISLVISLVIIARFLLKKSPKVFSYALWGVVLFRLVCPVTFESDFSIIPSPKSAEIYSNFVEIDAVTLNDISQKIVNEELPIDIDFIPQGGTLNQPTPVTPLIEIDRDYVTEIESNTSVVGGDVETNDKFDLMGIISYIWLVGFIVMSCFGVREFVKLHQSLIGCTRWKDCKYGENIYLCDNIKSPFVMGVFKAKIYIPSNIMNRDLDYIISHEKHHILRLDHITRIIGFIALSLHWFNPFVWIAFVLSGKDMELSCDEYVLGRADNTSVDIRADYSQALLYFACNLNCRRKLIAITPHAFGESGSTKERIVNIMTYKKTAVWVTVLLAGLVGFTSVALASDKTTDTIIEEVSTTVDEIVEVVEITTTEIKEIEVEEIVAPRVSNVAEIFANTPSYVTSEYKSGTRSINIDANVVIPQNITTVNTYKIVEEEIHDDIFDKIYANVFKDRLDDVVYDEMGHFYTVENPPYVLTEKYSPQYVFSQSEFVTPKNMLRAYNKDEWTNIWEINTYMTNPNLYIDYDQALIDCNQFLEDVGLDDYKFKYYNKVGAVSGGKAYAMYYHKNVDGLDISSEYSLDLGIKINYNNSGITEFEMNLYKHILDTQNLDIISFETAIECLNDSIDLIDRHADSTNTIIDYTKTSGKHYGAVVDTGSERNVIGTFNVKEITFEYVVNYNGVDSDTVMKPCWRFIISPNDSYVDRDIVIAIDAVTGELFDPFTAWIRANGDTNV